MQDFRRSLPQQSRLIVCKNTLLKQAVDKSGNGFSELSQAAKVDALANALRLALQSHRYSISVGPWDRLGPHCSLL